MHKFKSYKTYPKYIKQLYEIHECENQIQYDVASAAGLSQYGQTVSGASQPDLKIERNKIRSHSCHTDLKIELQVQSLYISKDLFTAH